MSVTQPAIVNLTELIERQKIGSFQLGIAAMAAAAMFVDGFDIQIMAYAAPAVSRTWAIAPAMLGWVLSAGQVGTTIGSVLWTPLSDRIGRKPILLLSLLIFGLGSLATPMAHSAAGLFWFRAATGIGLGGVMPNCMALTSEYVARRFRTAVLMSLTFGVAAGGSFGGVMATYLIPHFGWPAVFYAGGIAPLALVPVLLLAQPESIFALALRPGNEQRIARTLRRIDPALDYDPARTRFVTNEVRSGTFPLAALFADGRAPVTLLIWLLFAMNLLDLYFLSSWMPTLLRRAGMAESAAILTATLIHLGAFTGNVVVTVIGGRIGTYTIIIGGYVLAGMFTAALGPAGSSVPLAVVASFGAGICFAGSQLLTNSLTASFYPTEARATGVGWALGVGRFGAIFGPVVAGMLVATHWTTPAIFAAGAMPAVVATVAALMLSRLARDPVRRRAMIGEPRVATD